MSTHTNFKRFGVVAIGICLGLATSIVSAATYTADFSGAPVIPDFSIKDSPDWTTNVGGGILRLQGGNPVTLTSGGLTFSHRLTGDFTATVDVDLSSSTNAVAQLVFFGDAGSNLLTNISLYRTNSNGTASVGGWDPIINAFPTNWHGLSTSMTLQMRRLGNTFSEYIAPVGSDDFVLWHSFSSDTWQSVGGEVGFRLRQHAPSETDIAGAFSNFTVTTPVPEPETYAMLLVGLGLVGSIARRRKQT